MIYILTPNKNEKNRIHRKADKGSSSTYAAKSAIEGIKKEFEKYVGLLSVEYLGGKNVDDNEIHWFFQEYLEGVNGVCHYFKYHDEEFSYAVSKNQGDIVTGKMSADRLSQKMEAELKKVAMMLFQDLGEHIQLEFVIHDNKVYIVQLRTLENNTENSAQIGIPENVLYEGKTFSFGNVKSINVKDILIIDSEAKSEELIGKKALIVEQDVQFSHILALSKSLKIPSIYGTGRVDLSGEKKVKITAYNKEGFISKI